MGVIDVCPVRAEDQDSACDAGLMLLGEFPMTSGMNGAFPYAADEGWDDREGRMVRPAGLEPAKSFSLKICANVELLNVCGRWWTSLDIVTFIVTRRVRSAVPIVL